MKIEEAKVGLIVRVRDDVWREWCIRQFKEYAPFKPQPIVQLSSAPPYDQYIVLAFPFWLWKPEELEVEGQMDVGMTVRVAETRFQSFQRGWFLGASGQMEAAAIGTPEPQYLEEYQEGYRQGLEAFNTAMRAAFKRLVIDRPDTEKA